MSCDRMIGPFKCCSVVQGDCLELMQQLDDGSVDAVITDPPYCETSLGWDKWPKLWLHVAPCKSLWCFGSMRMFFDKLEEFSFSGWKLSQDIVWEKQNGSGFAVDRFNRVHEYALHFYRGSWSEVYHETPRVPTDSANKSMRFRSQTPHRGEIGNTGYVDDGTRLVRSVLQIPNEHGKADHPTQKPVTLVQYLVEYATPEGGIILDPFAGSGTTLVAAAKLGRHFLGFEIYPEYCEIARKRIAAVEAQPTLFEKKPEQQEFNL